MRMIAIAIVMQMVACALAAPPALDELKAAWKQTRSELQKFRQVGMTSTEIRTASINGPAIGETKQDSFVQLFADNASVLMILEFSSGGQWSSEAVGANPDYSFLVGRQDPNAQWHMDELCFGAEMPRLVKYAQQHREVLLLFRSTPIEGWFESPFRLESVEEVAQSPSQIAHDAGRLVRTTSIMERDGNTWRVTLVFDESKNWMPIDGEMLEMPVAPGMKSSRTHNVWSGFVAINGLLLPTSMEMTHYVEDEVAIQTTSTIDYKDVNVTLSSDDFRLGRFGLPEPVSTQTGRIASPYLLPSIAGIALVILAVYLARKGPNRSVIA